MGRKLPPQIIDNALRRSRLDAQRSSGAALAQYLVKADVSGRPLTLASPLSPAEALAKIAQLQDEGFEGFALTNAETGEEFTLERFLEVHPIDT